MDTATPHHDAIIVGASLAGAATAVQLARQGFGVLLLDRAAFPRPKICGEGLMPAGIEILRGIGVFENGRPAWAKPFRGLRFHLPTADEIGIEFPGGEATQGWIMSRNDLDLAALKTASAESGIEVKTGWSVTETEIGDRGVDVTLRQNGRLEKCSGRILVGANGIHSSFYRRVGIRRRPVLPARFALRGRHAGFSGWSNRVEIFCNPAGEAYVVALAGGGARVSLLLDGLRRSGKTKEELYREVIDGFPGLEGRLSELTQAKVESRSPLAFRLDRSHDKRLVLVGDAAGAVDPVTGQGMTIALRDSVLAGEVIGGALQGDRLSASDLADYTKRRKAYFEPSFQLAQQVLFLLRHPRLAHRAAKAIRRNPDLRQRLGVMAAASKPTSLSLRDGIRFLLGF